MWKTKKNISIITIIFIITVFIVLCIGFTVKRGRSAEVSIHDSGSILYNDVKETDWFYNDVKYISENGIMNGTDDGLFSPYEKTTRGMIVTILWRLDGKPKEDGDVFNDVSENAYYYDAVTWASNHQIVNGISKDSFGPDDIATREQMITIMYRYASYKNYDISQSTSLTAYTDKNLINNYAIRAMEWGCANNIISGTSDTELSPQDYTQRCQVAAILKRFCTRYADINGPGKEDNQPSADLTQKNPVFTNEPENSHSNDTGSGSSSGSTSEKPTNLPDTLPSYSPSTESSINENDNPTLTVTSAIAKPGDNVQISIEVSNNPGILGMTLIAYYDETYCTLESVKSGDAFEGILDLTTSKTLNSGVKLVWDGIDLTDNQIKDGTIAVLDFHIADNAPDSRIPITLKCYEGDAFNRDLEAIPLQIDGGNITVKPN